MAIALGDTPIVTNAATFELIRNAGLDAVIRGGIIPTVRETIQATTALEAMERGRDPELDLNELQRQVQALITVVQVRFSADEWTAVVAEVQREIEGDVADADGPDRGESPDA